MVDLDDDKFYEAIYSFLNETMDDVQANNKTNVMVKDINEMINQISIMVSNDGSDALILSKKFHTLKNLLLYGDFYYESDLCQDIELKLRETKKVTSIDSIYEELIDSLKM